MIRNYIITALRNFNRFRSYSIVNLFGLSAGMAAVLLIYTFIAHEVGFDRFHENYGSIYRIGSHVEMAGDHSITGPVSQGRLPVLLPDAIPEITTVTRIDPFPVVDIEYRQNRFRGNNLFYVDKDFLDIFTFPVIEGDPAAPLEDPGNVVITADLANKIFGTTQASGESITVDGRDYMVSAVVENPPVQSHLRFDLLITFSSLPDEEKYIDNRGFSFHSYFLLDEVAGREAALETTKEFITGYYRERLSGTGITATPFLQPLSEIYLHSEHIDYDVEYKGSMSNIYIFSLLALFILIIAVVNHINLATARAETRSKEVALRKITGATRTDLVKQFISESVITTLIATAIAVSLAELIIPSFGNIVGRNLTIEYGALEIWVFLIVTVLVVGLAAGSYPAFYLARFRPVRILFKTEASGRARGRLLKITLVVFQFAIAIFLITCLVILQRQVRYMQTGHRGFTSENVVILDDLTSGIRESYEVVKKELLSLSEVLSVAGSNGIPGRHTAIQNSYPAAGNREDAIMMYEVRVHDGYFKTFEIPFVSGTNFSREMHPEIILNEEAVRALGLEDPLGEEIYVWEFRGRVVGVVRDYHFQSLHEPIKPIAHTRFSPFIQYMPVRIAPGDTAKTLEAIRKVMQKFDPDYVFSYFFMDKDLRQSYEQEERSAKLVGFAAALSIIVSLLGIYALTSFTIIKRTREIGIRKVLGATAGSILFMLYRDLGRWVLPAIVIGWTFAWYVMKGWLENFAYRIEMEPWMFIFSGAAALVVAILTVTGLAVRGAHTNPADSLKYE